ncbi:MAG: V-type ATP synthase subunit D [Candidatus Omnitrophota bacterium]
MQLRVSPNRMELLRLRRRLVLAQRGYKLLQDKLEQMMYKFLSLIKEAKTLSDEVNKKIKQVFLHLVISRGLMPEKDFIQALKTAGMEMGFQSDLAKIMNVPIPQFSFKEPTLNLDYDFFKVSPQLDIALNELRDLLPSLVRLGGLFKSCQLLSFEIERTRRRVNALEYLLIPSISETIRSITDKLNEFERSALLRLMRIKEVLK